MTEGCQSTCGAQNTLQRQPLIPRNLTTSFERRTAFPAAPMPGGRRKKEPPEPPASVTERRAGPGEQARPPTSHLQGSLLLLQVLLGGGSKSRPFFPGRQPTPGRVACTLREGKDVPSAPQRGSSPDIELAPEGTEHCWAPP